MPTLATRVNEFIDSVRDVLINISPKLLPKGGNTGQVLLKQTNSSFDVTWSNELKAYLKCDTINVISETSFVYSLSGIPAGDVFLYINGLAQPKNALSLNINLGVAEITLSPQTEIQSGDVLIAQYAIHQRN